VAYLKPAVDLDFRDEPVGAADKNPFTNTVVLLGIGDAVFLSSDQPFSIGSAFTKLP